MTEDNSIIISKISADLAFEADHRGAFIKLPSSVQCIEDAIELIEKNADSPFGKRFIAVLSLLLESETCTFETDSLLVPENRVIELYETELGLSQYLPDFAPYLLFIKAQHSLGYARCRLKAEFFAGGYKIAATRYGAFVSRENSLYVLPTNLAKILNLIDTFNSETDEFRSDYAASLRFLGKIKALQDTNTKFDKYLSGQDVMIVPKIGVELNYEPTGRVSLLPCIKTAENEDFWRSFKQSGQVESIYEVADTREHKYWVIPEPEVLEVLKVLRNLQHLSNSEKHKILCDPIGPFIGKADLELIDFSGISRSTKELQRHVGRISWTADDAESPRKQGKVCLTLECIDGSAAKIPVHSLQKRANFIIRDGDIARLRNPITNEELILLNDEKLLELEREIEFFSKGQNYREAPEESAEAPEDTIADQRDNLSSSSELPNQPPSLEARETTQNIETPSHTRTTKKSFSSSEAQENTLNSLADHHPGYKFNQSHSNVLFVSESGTNPNTKQGILNLSSPAERLSAPTSAAIAISSYTHESLDDDALDFSVPRSLTASVKGKRVSLKRYQKQGIAWLQYSYALSKRDKRPKRAGSLLADDMGLGKTLQVLTFLASCLEDSTFNGYTDDARIFRPILIVAPLILLNVWQSEITKFFRNAGQIFSPFEVLYGTTLQEYRSRSGKEGKSLDIDRLKRQKLVITNYNTMKNHVDALETIKWSIIVADEAQEIKEPETATSKCLKRLNTDFRVALTGTPVENRLSELWSIIDFAQPGILGTINEFRKSYDANLDKVTEVQRRERDTSLRKRLCFNENSAYVIRRRKQDNLDGLPKKQEHLVYSELTPEQIQLHKDIVSYARSVQGAAMAAVQRLMYLYQHAALITEDKVSFDADHYLRNSQKLKSVIAILDDISRKREKVLLFTRSLLMQQILRLVIRNHFGIDSHIIKGESGHSTNQGHRQKLIEDFEKQDGFNTLILNPEVAGVGLTIIGANNVIHYGRWWNPAVENQATDRCYRLGQTRTVNVYYPISVSDEIKSFDERLQKMLWQKKVLASDFLVPTETLSVSQKELFEDLTEDYSSAGTPTLVDPAYLDECKPETLEELYSCILRKQGFDTYLSKRAQGFPLFVGRRGNCAKIIVCRSNEQRSLRDDIEDALCTVEQLREKLGENSKLVWEPTLVANHLISQAQMKEAKTRCDLLDQAAIQQALRVSKVTITEMLREKDSRMVDHAEIIRHLTI